jgi:hypothetical protein
LAVVAGGLVAGGCSAGLAGGFAAAPGRSLAAGIFSPPGSGGVVAGTAAGGAAGGAAGTAGTTTGGTAVGAGGKTGAATTALAAPDGASPPLSANAMPTMPASPSAAIATMAMNSGARLPRPPDPGEVCVNGAAVAAIGALTVAS